MATRRPILVASVVLAVLIPIAARILAGPNGAFIHVRWREDVDDATRQRLEARFTLTRAERLDGTTWRYELIDTSGRTLGALVSEPAGEDTHHIDRRSST